MKDKYKEKKEAFVDKVKEILVIINEKRPRRDKHTFLKEQILDLKDDLVLQTNATQELEEFRTKCNELTKELDEIGIINDTIKVYRENYQNAIEQLTTEIGKKQVAEKRMKSMEIEKLALEEICYKKTEEVIVTSKELEILKKEYELKEKARGKERGDYIG